MKTFIPRFNFIFNKLVGSSDCEVDLRLKQCSTAAVTFALAKNAKETIASPILVSACDSLQVEQSFLS